MNACPKCQTKNQDSSRFCKKCGFQLSNSSFQDKKEKVLGEKKGKPYWVPVSLAIVAIALAGIGYWVIQGNTAANPKVSSQPKVSGKVDYAGQTVRMSDIQAKVEKGKISIPLSEVMEKKMVRFEYQANGVSVPLLSYITQSGRVVTAVSMCEPCKSTRFHIKDKTLVCNACYTEWDLENLKGIKGGCLNYPPDVIPSTIEKGSVQIDEKVVTEWKPRV
jgi:uncharacterized membrane protein